MSTVGSLCYLLLPLLPPLRAPSFLLLLLFIAALLAIYVAQLTQNERHGLYVACSQLYTVPPCHAPSLLPSAIYHLDLFANCSCAAAAQQKRRQQQRFSLRYVSQHLGIVLYVVHTHKNTYSLLSTHTHTYTIHTHRHTHITGSCERIVRVQFTCTSAFLECVIKIYVRKRCRNAGRATTDMGPEYHRSLPTACYPTPPFSYPCQMPAPNPEPPKRQAAKMKTQSMKCFHRTPNSFCFYFCFMFFSTFFSYRN